MNSIPSISPSDSWAEAWTGFQLDMTARNLSAKTVASRRTTIWALARRMTERGVEPAGVTRQLLQQYMIAELEARKNSGAVTVFANLRAFWTWYAAEYGTASPVAGLPRPKGQAAPVSVLTGEQVAAILKACSGADWEAVRNRAIVLLLLESGIRRSELLALTPEDVDVLERTVTVRRGKGGKARVSVYGPETAQALHRWLRKRGDGPGALFLGRRGNDLSNPGVGGLLYRVGRSAGVPGLRAHMFRHAWTHYMLEAGMREHDIMALAGWSTGKQLARYGAALAAQRAIAAGKAIQVASVIRSR